MKIIPRAVAFSAPSTLLAILLVWCHCVLCSVYAKSLHHSRTTSVDNVTEIVGNCELVRPYFESKNITLVSGSEDYSNTTCHGKCCGKEMEERLKQKAWEDFHSLIQFHSKSLQGLLVTTASTLKDTVIVLLRKSENKTLIMFEQVYKSMAVLTMPSIRALYQAMVDYVSPTDTLDDLQQSLTRDRLQERFREFFTYLFPIAYHHVLYQHQDRRDFTEKFKSCLYKTMDDIQPFGDVPQDIFKKISKSLEAIRVLVQALNLGESFLDKIDSALFTSGSNSPQQEACHNALLRMTYCPKCKGLRYNVQSCNGFCINVVRGCLTESAYELDLAWSGYVETVGRLVGAVDNDNNPLGLNIKNAVRELDTRMSDVIMHTMEDGPQLGEKVRKVCGRSELLPSDEESPASSNAAAKSLVSPGMVHTAASSLTLRVHENLLENLHKQIGNFMAGLEMSRFFYMMLADTICNEYPRKHCWNGEHVGDYTKTVVDSSPNAQRYNPEITLTTTSSTSVTYAGNTNISALIDQLRHINQLVQTQLASSPDAGAFLGDEALDGSGSGDSPVWRQHTSEIDDDEDGHDDDRDDDEASGSGMGPTTSDPSTKTHHTDPNRATRSSTILLPIALAIICASLIA